MLAIFGLSRLLGRPTAISNLLFLSAALRLVMRPDELTSPGFLLTYAATFGLVVIGASISRATTGPARLALAYGLGAELCTQPLTLLFFRHYTIGGFLITIVLSPMLSAIIVLSIPLSLVLVVGSDLAAPILTLVSVIDHAAVTINDLASTLKLTGIAPAPSGTLVVTCFVGLEDSLEVLECGRFVAGRRQCFCTYEVILGERLRHRFGFWFFGRLDVRHRFGFWFFGRLDVCHRFGFWFFGRLDVCHRFGFWFECRLRRDRWFRSGRRRFGGRSLQFFFGGVT